MPRTTIKGFVVTTDPIPKYKGHSFPPELMYVIAQKIREGGLPLCIEHDRRDQLNHEVHLVEVRKTETEKTGVWVEIEIDEKDRERLESKKAFSISIQETVHYPDPTNTKPKLTIDIDPAYFDEETIQSAIKDLEQHFAIEVRYLYQLADNITLISIMLNIAEGTAGHLLAASIYTVLQQLFSKSKRNQESELIIEKKNEKITLKTNNPKLLERALDKFIPSE